MSVIAIWNGRMGADTMGICSVTGLWLPQQKIHVINNEIAIAVCGESLTPAVMGPCARALGNLIGYMEYEDETLLLSKEEYAIAPNGETPAYQGDDPINTIFALFHDTTGLVMTKRGVYIVENYGILRYDNDLPLVSGSGAPVALTALLWGESMETAIEMATRHGSLARGEAVVVTQRSLNRIKRTKQNRDQTRSMVR